MQRLHVIYIPGLGDKYDPIRRLGLRLWRGRNVDVTHVPMRWSDPVETFGGKRVRLREAIDTHPDHKTILVGESAGGPVAIVASRRFTKRVDRIVTVCGMNQGADTVSPRRYQNNPAFKDAMTEVDELTPLLTDQQKRCISILYSSADETVRPHYTLLQGVASYNLKTPGHALSILSVLFLRFNLITKRQ